MRAVAMTLNAICRSIVLLNLRSESFIVSTFGWFKNFVFETNDIFYQFETWLKSKQKKGPGQDNYSPAI